MTARHAWAWCVLAGALAFVASFLFGRIPGLKPCGPADGLGAVLAFEFVRSPADVVALFGAEPCRATLIAAQRTGLLLDGLWFIPAYTAFLCLAAQASRVRWRRWTIGVLLIAGLSDEIEGLILWSILDALPGTQGRIDALWAAVHLKFALLALGTAGVGRAIGAPGWRRLPSAVIAAAGVFALLQLALGNIAAMMQAFAIGWFALLAYAAWGAVSGRRRPEPTPPAA